MPSRALAKLLLIVCALVPSAGAAVATAPPPTVPVSTLNDFIPTDRDLTECISALPKPGCGSKARSDWHQGLLFGALFVGMAFIGWRIVHTARRPRPT